MKQLCVGSLKGRSSYAQFEEWLTGEPLGWWQWSCSCWSYRWKLDLRRLKSDTDQHSSSSSSFLLFFFFLGKSCACWSVCCRRWFCARMGKRLQSSLRQDTLCISMTGTFQTGITWNKSPFSTTNKCSIPCQVCRGFTVSQDDLNIVKLFFLS